MGKRRGSVGGSGQGARHSEQGHRCKQTGPWPAAACLSRSRERAPRGCCSGGAVGREEGDKRPADLRPLPPACAAVDPPFSRCPRLPCGCGTLLGGAHVSDQREKCSSPPAWISSPQPEHHRVKEPLNRAGLPRWLGGAFGGHQGSAFEAAGGQESRQKEAGMAVQESQAKTPRMSGENFHSRGLNRPKRRSKMPPPVQAAGLGRGGGDWDSRPPKSAQHSSPALPPRCQAKIPVHFSPDSFCLVVSYQILPLSDTTSTLLGRLHLKSSRTTSTLRRVPLHHRCRE